MLPHKNLDEQIVVMAMTDGKASAPGLTISWKRQVETPWYFYGGLVLGSLFVLVGAFLFFIDLQLRRANVDRRTRSAERAARIANADSVSTEGIPQVDDPDRRLSRRELRDKERAEASGEPWTDPRTGRIYLDGVETSSASQAPETLPTGGYDYGPAVGLSAGSGSGFGDGADVAYGEGHGGQGEHTVAGVARGASVVPGLDEAATQQYRAAREPEDLLDGEALAITSDAAQVSDSSASFNPAALSDAPVLVSVAVTWLRAWTRSPSSPPVPRTTPASRLRSTTPATWRVAAMRRPLRLTPPSSRTRHPRYRRRNPVSRCRPDSPSRR